MEALEPARLGSTRRAFVRGACGAAALAMAGGASGEWPSTGPSDARRSSHAADGSVLLFLAGDVMTGRGLDQLRPRSVDPRLHEPWVESAETYVEIAERASGPIPDDVEPGYFWGVALEVLAAEQSALRIINLETAITADGEPWPGKGIHYRMHPDNVAVLTAAGIDACALANNHVLDWGRSGLTDTLRALDRAGVAHAGAGATIAAASAPAVVARADGGRVLLVSVGHGSSGIPKAWAAAGDRSGVWLRPLTEDTVTRLARIVSAVRREGDLVVVSVHWGGNWGWEIPPEQRRFAHDLVARAGADVVHGHSSHHPKAVEVFRERLILYGCGDFINDYEGISGHEAYRPQLRLMYLPRLESPGGRLLELEMVALESRRFRLRHAGPADRTWMAAVLDRECSKLGTGVELESDGRLVLRW